MELETMLSENVFTVEEISNHLRVPEDAVMAEVTAGRLRALNIAGHIRVRESDLNSYLSAEFQATSVSTAKKGSLNLTAVTDFDQTWPAVKGEPRSTERFTDAREGIVRDDGRERHIKIGFTFRKSAGKLRRRSLVLVNRYATVEFVAADERAEGKMASIIRGRDGKQLQIGATLPPEYKDLPVGPYNSVVQGPHASNGLAVICDSQDVETMVRHALIRYRFREARASAPKVSV
jgi:excisionase family DNA binding protein